MPFEIPQQEPQVEVGPYQHFADAMLRGCALRPHQCRNGRYFDGELSACAMGALYVAMGNDADEMRCEDWTTDAAMVSAYEKRYGSRIPDDNDGGMTREQIAARIAALR